MSRRLTSLLVLSALTAGCSVTELRARDRSIAVNECSADSGCPNGQACSALGCIATSGILSNLLFEVIPGISSDPTTTAQFFKRLETIPLVPTATTLGTGFKPGSVALELSKPVDISGSIEATGCDISFADSAGAQLPKSLDGSIPARLTFVPSEQMWGLAASSVTTTTSWQSSSSYAFQVSLPGGGYDVYVEPFEVASSGAGQPKSCTVLPQLFRAQDLSRSSSLKLGLATPKHIELKLRFPESEEGLDGWRVDLLEPVTGRVLSNAVQLELPTRSDGVLVYAAALDYVPVWGDDPKITHGELVRLAPPKDVDAPTLFFWREGLEWATPGEGVVDQLGVFPSAVSLSGGVRSPGPASTGVPATVTFTATQVSGVAGGLFPSFIRSVETDEAGDFQLNLVPGTYKAMAVPRAKQGDRPYALSTTMLTVSGTSPVQAGATLTVGPAFSLQGTVFTSRGEGAWGAVVSAEVSPSRITSSTFDRAIGDLPIVPRAASATIRDTSGSYQLFAEPGVYDLSVRSPASSRYAWLVMPGFEPALGATDGLDISVPDLRLPAPLPVELVVNWSGNRDPDPSLIAASINAYALVDETGEPTTDARAAVSAVRVAEGRLDDSGHVTLMLPAKLERPPEGFASAAEPQQ